MRDSTQSRLPWIQANDDLTCVWHGGHGRNVLCDAFVCKLWSYCNESAVSPSRIRHFDIPTWSVLGAKICFFKVKVHFGAVGGISVIPVGFPHAIRTTKSTFKGVTHRLFNAQGLILAIWSHFTAGVLDTDFG